MKHALLSLVRVSVAVMAAGAFVSCVVGEPRVVKVNGHTRVYTPKRVCGLTYSTTVEEIRTPAQAKEALEIKAMEDQQRTEAKRASIALWLGGLMMVAALACAVYAYLRKGFAKYGGLAAWCAVLGGMCWGFVEFIAYLKWFVLASLIGAVGLFLYENRNFDWIEWRKQSKEN